MKLVKHFITEICSRYFRNLPVPRSAKGWLKLSFYEWISLMPPTAVFAGFCYMVYLAYWPGARKSKSDIGKCNPGIRKYVDKVVDHIDVENIYDEAAFCRCWRSKNWPYCDGSHAAYNFAAADNVGPLIAKNYLLHASDEQRISSPERKLSDKKLKFSGPERKFSDTELKFRGPEQKLSDTELKLSGPEQKLSDTELKFSDLERKLSDTELKLSSSEQKLSDTELKFSGPERKLSDSESKF